VFHFDATDAHGGEPLDPRTAEYITLEDFNISNGSAQCFEFTNLSGWGSVVGFRLKSFNHLLGVIALPVIVGPVICEGVKCDTLSSANDAHTFIQCEVTAPDGRAVDIGFQVWNTSSPSETQGSSWCVGRKIDHTTNPNLVLKNDTMLLCDSSGGAVTVTLLPVDEAAGMHLQVVDWAGSASVHAITIAPRVTETIDGVASVSMTDDGAAAHVYCDGLENRTIPTI